MAARARSASKPITSLRGRTVVFTGRLERNGVWVRREEAARLAKSRGARVRGQRSRASRYDDLLVIGSSDLWIHGHYGRQEEHALALQAQGSSIEIIDQDGFFDLIDGRLAIPLRRGRGAYQYPSGCRAYRYEKPDVDVSEYALVSDGTALQVAVETHRELQRVLADGVLDLGFTPMSPSERRGWFDVAWVDSDGCLQLVEIKSLNDRRAIRAGVGQVLDYAVTFVRDLHVTAHLLLGASPDEPAHWEEVGRRAGVSIWWDPKELLNSMS